MGPVGPTDKENQVRCVKRTVLGTIPLRNGKDPDPYQIEKQDPDQYQSEKQDPETYQKGLDPQHWLRLLMILVKVLTVGDWAECEEGAGQPHPHPGVLQGVGEACEKSLGGRLCRVVPGRYELNKIFFAVAGYCVKKTVKQKASCSVKKT